MEKKSVKKRIHVAHKVKENKALYTWVLIIAIVLGLLVLWQIFRIGARPGQAILVPEAQHCCCDCLASKEVVKLDFFKDCLEACRQACKDEIVAVKACTPPEAVLFLKHA